MITAFRRISGIILALLAAASLVISVFIVVRLWQLRTPATENLDANVGKIIVTLENTQAAIEVAGEALETTAGSVDTLHVTLDTISKAMKDAEPMFASLDQLLDEDLPGTISSTQTSLEAAQSSAMIIDAVLTTFNSFPFIQGDPYNPPVPLHESLADISDSLGEIPASFDDLNASLTQASKNMIALRVDLNEMQSDLDDVSENLELTQDIIASYRENVADYHDSLVSFREKLPTWSIRLAWLLTFAILWLAVAQWGLLLQGLAYAGLYRRTEK